MRVTALLAGLRPTLAKILRNVHSNEWLPADRIHLKEAEVYSATLNAVRHAYTLLNQARKTEDREAVYYLV
jgi:sulfate permease, SulP family